MLIGGIWRTITRGETYRDGAWRSCLSFAAPLSLTVSPDDVVGFGRPERPQRLRVTTTPAVATPSGGSAPYSYSWVNLTGAAIIDSPASAGTTFSATIASGTSVEGEAQVTCTDAQGRTAVGQVRYSLYNETNQ